MTIAGKPADCPFITRLSFINLVFDPLVVRRRDRYLVLMAIHLVTGGAGFIGSHLVTALVARGDRVCVLDNLSAGRRANLDHVRDQVELVEGDLTDRRAVERALDGVELVFHQAALASVPRSVTAPLETNAACVTGTEPA